MPSAARGRYRCRCNSLSRTTATYQQEAGWRSQRSGFLLLKFGTRGGVFPMTALPGSYRYTRPSTLEEALALKGEVGAMVLAGGQTLIPRLTAGIASPAVLVDWVA